MTTPQAVLRLRDLEVRYPEFTLGPVSLQVVRGERIALVGPNGAGKSTVIRAICGLQGEYGGSVTVDGRDVRALGPRVRTRIGVLPERMLGFGWMTVEEHLRFLSSFYPSWDDAYAEELREGLGLPAGTRLANLSKGMQVKLSLVTAEAHRPRVLLLDEPTSGIDPVMRGELLALIRQCAPSGGDRTVIFSSHLLEDVEAVARRVLLLRNGRLCGDLDVGELAAESADGSVASAIYRRLTSE
ncbi:MAG: ABC transporter ATP-binding protein [Gemmatimonadetes bacterium]|nr:ABC transporter ATP-binding protein [Gemmatimonadota bacterium]